MIIRFLLLSVLGASAVMAQTTAPKKPADIAKMDPAMAASKAAMADVEWHDATTWGVEGRGWVKEERQRWFDRLPAKAEGKVTSNVWNLSRDSSGMMVRFKTDATAIFARYKLSKPLLGMPHMPATGVSGLDLYARDADGKWKWVMVTRPAAQLVETKIIDGLSPGLRDFAAYLPLYNGVDSLEIGVPKGAKFEGQGPRSEKPIIFYGTSITHGACASRPGMVHTAILGRRFDMPVMNLGFSGNGKMDAAVGALLCEQEASAYVIDCLPNMGAAEVTAKCEPLVKQLRAAHADTPIVLVEDRRNTNSWIIPSRDQHHTDNHAALKAAYEKLKAAGVAKLYYIGGDHLYGDDTEGATDASHASDLGFMRQADVMEPVLREAMGKK